MWGPFVTQPAMQQLPNDEAQRALDTANAMVGCFEKLDAFAATIAAVLGVTPRALQHSNPTSYSTDFSQAATECLQRAAAADTSLHRHYCARQAGPAATSAGPTALSVVHSTTVWRHAFFGRAALDPPLPPGRRLSRRPCALSLHPSRLT